MTLPLDYPALAVPIKGLALAVLWSGAQPLLQAFKIISTPYLCTCSHRN